MKPATHRNLELLASMRDQLLGGRIVEVAFWTHPDGWSTPALVIETEIGDVVRAVVSANEDLSEQGFILLNDSRQKLH